MNFFFKKVVKEWGNQKKVMEDNKDKVGIIKMYKRLWNFH